MSKRDLRLDKFGISRKRYKELSGFCEQYPEWKAMLKSMNLTPSMKLDGSPPNPNIDMADPVGNAAIKRETLEYKCDLIERSAKLASEDLWEFIIKQVCYEVPLTYLKMVEGMPCEKSSFYEIRRYFFYVLDIEKKKNAENRRMEV